MKPEHIPNETVANDNEIIVAANDNQIEEPNVMEREEITFNSSLTKALERKNLTGFTWKRGLENLGKHISSLNEGAKQIGVSSLDSLDRGVGSVNNAIDAVANPAEKLLRRGAEVYTEWKAKKGEQSKTLMAKTELAIRLAIEAKKTLTKEEIQNATAAVGEAWGSLKSFGAESKLAMDGFFARMKQERTERHNKAKLEALNRRIAAATERRDNAQEEIDTLTAVRDRMTQKPALVAAAADLPLAA